jgi:hypothetical protein
MAGWPRETRKSTPRRDVREALASNLRRAFPLTDCSSFGSLLEMLDMPQEPTRAGQERS